MPLTDSDYNAFSVALVERLTQRAKGLDDGSKRIVNLRPSDHILSGFLELRYQCRRQSLRTVSLQDCLKMPPKKSLPMIYQRIPLTNKLQ